MLFDMKRVTRVRQYREARANMNIAGSIAVSANVSLKNCITGSEIVEIFRSGNIPAQYIPNIGIIFAETHPDRLASLFAECDISFDEAQRLYEAVSNFYHTARMEKFLYGDVGKTA